MNTGTFMNQSFTRHILALTVLFPVLCFAQRETKVPLSRAVLPDTGQLTGSSNIFFGKITTPDSGYSLGWKEPEVASLLENELFLPINIVRYKDASGATHYVIDTDGDSNFLDDQDLKFRTLADRSIADADVEIRYRSSIPSKSWKVRYQIILAGGYTYARIAEYRTGILNLRGKGYSLTLRPFGRNTPYFSLSGTTVCFIDMNRDGSFSDRWGLRAEGEIVPSEEIQLSEPFMIQGKKLKAVVIDSIGSALSIRESFDDKALSVGFHAPDFEFIDLHGVAHSLERIGGKVTLLMFWSTTCPFSEQIRPKLNSIIKRNESQTFSSFALSRETDTSEVKSYVKSHRYDATVGIPDSTLWRRYNSRTITPLFYLIDRDGIIRLIAPGASMAPVLDAMIRRLLGGH